MHFGIEPAELLSYASYLLKVYAMMNRLVVCLERMYDLLGSGMDFVNSQSFCFSL